MQVKKKTVKPNATIDRDTDLSNGFAAKMKSSVVGFKQFFKSTPMSTGIAVSYTVLAVLLGSGLTAVFVHYNPSKKRKKSKF